MSNRQFLQRLVGEWCERCFGEEVASDPKERARRVLEEAIELAQAEGIAASFVQSLTDHVYSRPPGNPAQEAGGVSVCLLAYCRAKYWNADDVEENELARILDKPPQEFEARQRVKSLVGLAKAPP